LQGDSELTATRAISLFYRGRGRGFVESQLVFG
jgi:hypothetical protein